MKALDKIFVPTRFQLVDCLRVKESDTDVEYIRKDIVDETIKAAEDHAYFAGREKLRGTLLEWAKAVKADPMLPMNIDKIIEKIESL